MGFPSRKKNPTNILVLLIYKPFSVLHLLAIVAEVPEVINHQIGPEAEVVAQHVDLLEENIDLTADTVIPEVISRWIDL